MTPETSSVLKKVVGFDYITYVTAAENIIETRIPSRDGYGARTGLHIKEGAQVLKNCSVMPSVNCGKKMGKRFVLCTDPKTFQIKTLTYKVNCYDTKEIDGITIDNILEWKKQTDKVFHLGMQQFKFGRSVWRNEIYTGSDPELFAVDPEGKVIPSWAFLPKKDPTNPVDKYDPFSQKYSYQDGFQVELGVAPNMCYAYLMDAFHACLQDAARNLYKFNPEAKLSWRVMGDCPMSDGFSDEQIELGCMPSLNAYDLKPAIDKVDARTFTRRPAGMHMHYSYSKHQVPSEDSIKFIKLLDRFVGVPSVSILRGLEDTARRKYYGLPGEYRLPDHGIEYRAVSSAGLCHPIVTSLLFELGRMAWGVWTDHKGLATRIIDSISDEEVQDIMLNLKIIKAKNWSHKLFGINNLSLKEWRSIYNTPVAAKVITAAGFVSKGARHFIDPDAFMDNWYVTAKPERAHSAKWLWTSHSGNPNACLQYFRFGNQAFYENAAEVRETKIKVITV